MIVAFTGAGISKPSGIPTYEDMPDMKSYMSREFAISNPDEFKHHLEIMASMVNGKEPNDAHVVLAENGVKVITMNIDDLHEMAGSRNVIHIHGSLSSGDMVLYGDDYDSYVMKEVDKVIDNCRVLLIIGTSFNVAMARSIHDRAILEGKMVFVIDSDAETRTRKIVESILR